MKQAIVTNHEGEADCNGQLCHKCSNCKAVNFEERRQEGKNNLPELYGKESEHYFFYYAVNMKQK